MQARVKQSSRYGIASLFSGREFVKFEWRKVPEEFEDQARGHPLLEIREGKAEKEVIAKQEKEAIKPVMKARLVKDYKDDSIRTFGMNVYTKDEWKPIPAGYEASARTLEFLEIWEEDQEEPVQKHSSKYTSTRKAKPVDKEEGKG